MTRNGVIQTAAAMFQISHITSDFVIISPVRSQLVTLLVSVIRNRLK